MKKLIAGLLILPLLASCEVAEKHAQPPKKVVGPVQQVEVNRPHHHGVPNRHPVPPVVVVPPRDRVYPDRRPVPPVVVVPPRDRVYSDRRPVPPVVVVPPRGRTLPPTAQGYDEPRGYDAPRGPRVVVIQPQVQIEKNKYNHTDSQVQIVPPPQTQRVPSSIPAQATNPTPQVVITRPSKTRQMETHGTFMPPAQSQHQLVAPETVQKSQNTPVQVVVPEVKPAPEAQKIEEAKITPPQPVIKPEAPVEVKAQDAAPTISQQAKPEEEKKLAEVKPTESAPANPVQIQAPTAEQGH